MANTDPIEFPIVAIGASAGGVEALWQLLAALPAQLPAAVAVVMHIPTHCASNLDKVLAKHSALPVVQVQDSAALRPGCVYVPRADRHLMIDGNRVVCTRGPKECRVRPAVNVLFRSVAETCGERAIGVVLSGLLDDGTAGLWAIKHRGGHALVQEPSDAIHDSMPLSALEHVLVDGVASAGELALLIAAAVDRRHAVPPSGNPGFGLESRLAAGEVVEENAVFTLGKASKYACPECHGVLTRIEEDSIVRFRCHTGHAYSSQTLLAGLSDDVDESLWNAVRALEEKLTLLELTATGAGTTRADDQIRSVRQRLEVLRDMLLSSSESSTVAALA